MNNPEIYLKTTLEDIVFENRNKNYGAYQLRKDTNRFLSIGMLIGFMFVTVLSAYSLTNKRSPVISATPEIIDTITVDITDLTTRELPKLPALQQPVEAPQQTAITQLIQLQVVEDAAETAAEDVVHIEDLPDDVPIGLENVSGPTGPAQVVETPAVAGGTGVTQPQADYLLWAGQMPEYIGGAIAMKRWLADEISYPRIALEEGVDGIVYVSFVVNTDGSVSDVKVERGIGYGCDEEAMRAVKKMKNWIPGKQNGNAVRVKQTIPIYFQITD